MQVGIAKSNLPQKRQHQLQQLLSHISLAELDREAAIAAASIRAQLEQEGTPIGPLDVLIAGTAVALKVTLVTHNLREFSRIPNLTLADWY